MLKKQTQRKLALYFSAMIFLNGMLFYRSLHGIAIGLSDFAIFYTAAEIVHNGEGRQLYDVNVQGRVQRAAVPGAVFERFGVTLPYNHPAFEAYAFLPLAFFSYRTAYLIWFAVNLGILAAIVAVLCEILPFLGQFPLYLWIGACLAFTPITIALIQGQDSILLLFLYCMAFIALRRSSEFSAGGWIALGLFRFQLSLPLILPFFLLKRWRVIVGFLLASTLLLFIALQVAGSSSLLSYPGFVLRLDYAPQSGWLGSSSGMPNLHGLFKFLIPPQKPTISTLIYLTGWLILQAASTFGFRKMKKRDPMSTELAFAGTLTVAILLSYHAWAHDLSVLLLAALLILEVIYQTPSASIMRNLSLACIGILWSPLSIVLVHFHHLEFFSVILLVLLATIWKQWTSGKLVKS